MQALQATRLAELFILPVSHCWKSTEHVCHNHFSLITNGSMENYQDKKMNGKVSDKTFFFLKKKKNPDVNSNTFC